MNDELIAVTDLKKYFVTSGGILSKPELLRAVDGVSFTIKKKSVMAIVGESGSGKSTVARMLLRLIPKTSGSILFKGREVYSLAKDELKEFRRGIQIVFQDPYASLNPRMKIYDALAEPLKIHKIVPKNQYKERITSILRSVGMDDFSLGRYPHEFSGGQRQRICIARALMLSPEVIVADEPISSLDVSIQAQILNLFREIIERTGASLLFISHDLNVVRYQSDEIAVMYLGRIVEMAKTDDLFSNPLHPYTRLLIDSVPRIDSAKKRAITIEDSAVMRNETSGCAFYPRCSRKIDICRNVTPELVCKLPERKIACHL